MAIHLLRTTRILTQCFQLAPVSATHHVAVRHPDWLSVRLVAVWKRQIDPMWRAEKRHGLQGRWRGPLVS
jgi:hypothetical protein